MFHLVQQRLGQWFPLAKPPGETRQAAAAAAGRTVCLRGCWDYITSGDKQQAALTLKSSLSLVPSHF